MSLDERLRGIEVLTQPTWVFDPEHGRIVWANRTAVELWRAESRQELLERDLSNVSQATRTRHLGYLAAFRQGRTVHEEWTWYPRGEPLTLRCAFSGIELDDGRMALLCEATVKQVDPDRAQLRGVEALRHTPSIVALLDDAGRVLMQNPAALRAFGEGSFETWFAEPERSATILREAGAGRVFRAELLVRTLAGQCWHDLEARPTLDPVTGAAAILIHQFDVTERREQKALIEAQRVIMKLSAPILRVGMRALAVPIIGAMDDARSADLAERLLARVVELQAHTVIVDLTGADAKDGSSAGHLTALLQALKLVGTRPILTGMQPALAKSLACAGIDLGDVVVLRHLHDGLRLGVAR